MKMQVLIATLAVAAAAVFAPTDLVAQESGDDQVTEKRERPRDGKRAGDGGGPRDPEERRARIQRHLGLDDAQSEQLHEIMMAHREKVRALHKEQQAAEEVNTEALRAELHAQLGEVLNEEQLAKWQELQKKRGRAGRGPRGAREGRGEGREDRGEGRPGKRSR